jgi:hypothetical protein
MNGIKRSLQCVAKSVSNENLIYGQRYTSLVMNKLGSVTFEVPEGLWIFQGKETSYYRDGLLLAVIYDFSNESRNFEFVFLPLKKMVFGFHNWKQVFAELNGSAMYEMLYEGPLPFIRRALTINKPIIKGVTIPM